VKTEHPKLAAPKPSEEVEDTTVCEVKPSEMGQEEDLSPQPCHAS